MLQKCKTGSWMQPKYVRAVCSLQRLWLLYLSLFKQNYIQAFNITERFSEKGTLVY